MKKYCFITLILLSFFKIHAQKIQFYYQIGHQFGFSKKSINDFNTGLTKAYTLGNGVANALQINVFPDSANWSYSIGVNSLFGNNTIVFKNDSINQYLVATRQLNSFRFHGQLNYHFKVKSIEIKLHSGVIVPIFNTIKEEETFKNESFLINKTYQMKHHFSLGYIGGIGISKTLNKKLSIHFSTQITLLKQRIKSKTLYQYQDNMNQSLLDKYPDFAQRNYLYHTEISEIRNNKTVLPNLYNKNKATDFLAYSETMNAMGFCVGLAYFIN